MFGFYSNTIHLPDCHRYLGAVAIRQQCLQSAAHGLRFVPSVSFPRVSQQQFYFGHIFYELKKPSLEHSLTRTIGKIEMASFVASILLTCFMISNAQGACPEIVTRGGWGARAVRSSGQMKVPVPHVFIHHTAGAKCSSRETCSKTARQTQNYHIDTNKWADIGYSFLVGGDGRIYEGRGWKGVGAHTVNYNSKALGISFMGNFDKERPSTAMLNAARNLIDCGVEKGYISKSREIHGHRDAKCTACPGAALYEIIKGWPGFKGGKLPGYKC